MAEPVFKLLRCDAEASHMLGWAKKEVRRLVNYASLDAFNRTWKFGDVSVRAQYFGGVARLWLEAEAAERLWFGFMSKIGMPSTVGVQILRRQPPAPTISWRDGEIPGSTIGDYSYEGVVFNTGVEIYNPGTPISTRTFQNWTVASSPFDVYIYTTVPPLLDLPPEEAYWPIFTGVHTYDTTPPQTQNMIGAYGDLAASMPEPVVSYGVIEVRLTDGTLLASSPHRRVYDAIPTIGAGYPGLLMVGTYVLNQPKQEQVWSGGGVLPLYERRRSVWQPTQPLTFDVPAKVTAPQGDWNSPTWAFDTSGLQFNAILSGHYDGLYGPPHSTVWDDYWRLGRTQAVERERARRLMASNELIDALRDKRVTAELKEFLKLQYPRSARTVRATPLRIVSGPTYTRVAQTTDESAPGFPYVNYERWEGRCTLAYTTIVDEIEVSHEKEYVGYCEWVKPVVSRRTPMGNLQPRHDYYTEYTYDNFPLLNNYGSAFFTVPAPGVQFLRASSTMKTLVDSGEVRLHDELNEPLFGVVNGTITHCPSWIPTNDGVFGFSPVYTTEVGLVTPSPMSEVNVVFDHTQWFKDYMQTAGVVKILGEDEAVPAARTQFLSSALPAGTAVRVVPLSAMFGADERGLFPHGSDMFNQHTSPATRLITSLKIYGYATVAYDAASDAFTIGSWVELPTPKILDIAASEAKYGIDLSSWLSTNCVCLGTAKWDDLQDEAKEQSEDMKDPAAPGGLFGAELCLYAEVKAALTPQE